MSDPRKSFQCTKCGFIINDSVRYHGKETECQVCRKHQELSPVLNELKFTKSNTDTYTYER